MNAEIYIYLWFSVDENPGGLMVRQVDRWAWDKDEKSRRSPTLSFRKTISGHMFNILVPSSWDEAMIEMCVPLLAHWLGKRKMLAAWKRFDRGRGVG